MMMTTALISSKKQQLLHAHLLITAQAEEGFTAVALVEDAPARHATTTTSKPSLSAVAAFDTDATRAGTCLLRPSLSCPENLASISSSSPASPNTPPQQKPTTTAAAVNKKHSLTTTTTTTVTGFSLVFEDAATADAADASLRLTARRLRKFNTLQKTRAVVCGGSCDSSSCSSASSASTSDADVHDRLTVQCRIRDWMDEVARSEPYLM